jgi:general stress protein 26
MNDVHELWDMLEDFHVCMATTRDGDVLRSRPMAPAIDPAEGVIRFLSAAQAPKVDEISAGHDINLSFADVDDMNFVSVSGRATISRDRALIRELWNPYADAWFEGDAETADVVVLTVRPTEAQYWDGNSSRVARMWEIAKAKMTGSKPDMGDSGKVDLSR